jgi:hypothetical protein
MSWKISIPFPFVPGEYYRVSQRFGENPQYYSQWGLAGHNGIDFACPTGTRILAVAPGQVTQVRTDGTGYGHHVRVAHTAFGKRFEAIYAHFSQNMVEPGQTVEVGTVLGLSGNTGNSTGPHLHFEIRPESQAAPGTFVSGAFAVDPEPFFVAYTPDQTPAAVLYAVKVLPWDGLVIRSQPLVNNANRIGVRLAGAVFEVVEETVDAGGNKWVRANSTVQQWSCWGLGGNVWLAVVSAVTPPEVVVPDVLSDAEKLEALWIHHPELH